MNNVRFYRKPLRLLVSAVAFSVILLAAAACDDAAATPTSVPAAQPTSTTAPAPTSTKVPTATTAPVATAAPTATAAMSTNAKTYKLSAMNGSGQDGTVMLEEQGDKTLVTVSVVAGAAGVSQPLHIHAGQCGASLGGVDFPLTALVDGKSVTTLDVKRSDILSKDRAVNLHKSAAEASVYTSCGAISGTGAAMMDDHAMTGNKGVKTYKLSAQNGSGQDGTVTLEEQGDKTLVTVSVVAGAAGVSQPLHIHAGQCGASLGGVDFPLTALVDSKSVTTVASKLSDILSKDRAVNLHKSAAEASVYTSCGAISGTGAAMMQDGGTAVPTAPAPTAAPTGPKVASSIKDFKFQDLTVNVGDTVVWKNDDTAPHTVTAGKPGATGTDFRSGTVEPGVTFSYTYTKAGVFDYYCEFHTTMVAKVTVN